MKTKKLLLSLFAAAMSFTQTISAQVLEWAQQLGSTSADVGYSVTTDAAGNVYTTGYFRGTVDFDPSAGNTTLTSGGSADIFISKSDAAGNFIWVKQMGGAGFDYGNKIVIDAAGNIYTTGFFENTADFDPSANTATRTAVGLRDIYLSKLDASGNFVWVNQIGGTANDECYSIAIDATNNIYITGFFQNTVDFDPSAATTNLTSSGSADIFVAKFNTAGAFIWAKKIGGTNVETGVNVALDTAGNVYTIGRFQGTSDFDPSANTTNLTSAGDWDIFISKLDASGNFVWAKKMGSTNADEGRSIALDATGNLYITGYFTGTVDFDPSANTANFTSAGAQDIFVSKFDVAGNFVWTKQMGGTANDYSYAIALDAADNIYTTGYFEGTADFDPNAGATNLISAGAQDIFVSKLDAAGNFVWAKKMGGANFDVGYAIRVHASNNVYTTGSFEGTADFDPSTDTVNLTSAGDWDIFVHKMSQCTTPITATTTTSVNTITANNNAGTYQWLDCNNNNAPIAGATNQSFTPTANGNYAVLLTSNGCTDTSACVNITLSAIIDNSFAASFSVYPNPTSGQVNIAFENEINDAQLIVHNAIGQEVYRQNYAAVRQIDFVLQSPAGIYFVEISANNKKAVLKVVKE